MKIAAIILLGMVLTCFLVYDLKDCDLPLFKKKSRTVFPIPDCQCIPPAPHFYRHFVDFFEVTLKSGKKEMVSRKNIFTIRASNEGGTIIMSPGGVAFTCTESYEKIKENLY